MLKKKSIVPQTSTVFRAQTNDVSVNKNARGDPNILESSYDLQRVMNKVSARSKVKPLKNWPSVDLKGETLLHCCTVPAEKKAE